VLDFTSDEIQILRCIGSGTSVGELRARLKDIWSRAQHALFSLLVRRHLVLARGASVLPAAWKQILAELEATLAVEELERSAPAAAPARPPTAAAQPAAAPRRPASPQEGARSPAGAPQPSGGSGRSETRSSTRAIDAGAAWGEHEPRHDFQGAGVGWRSQSRPRPPDADHLFRQATLDAEAGKIDSAIPLLRQALQLAPGDPEIAALLGRLAFRDRSTLK